MSLLLRNARVWPERELRSVFVDGARIAALEPRPADVTVDLEGAFLLPGFIDTHTHLGWAGAALWSVSWGDVASRGEALERIRATRTRLEPGFWLTGGGWSRDVLPDIELPTLEELDAVSGDAPAFLVCDDGSLGLVNSRAMQLMIVDQLPDPSGGTIERDSGRLHGAATRARMTRDVVAPDGRHRRLGEVRAALSELPRLGITEVHDIATYPGDPAVTEIFWERSYTDATLFDALELPVRVTVRPSLHRRHEFGPGTQRRSERVGLEGLKLFGGPTYRYPGRETATAWIREAHEAGLAVSVHSVDDTDVAETIDLFEPLGPGGPRHRVVHARSVRRRDIPRIACLGLVVEAQPWDTIAEPRIGTDPDAVELPLRSLLDAGVHVALGSDWRDDNLVPLDPLREIHAAVARESEAITVGEAIDCYTREGAYAGGSEGTRGRVAVGFDADLVALSADIVDEPDALLEAKALLTICAGRIVHTA